MVDDGSWVGAPVGGIGAGAIGRTIRGDFARWHLEPGVHRFEPVAADTFSLFVESGGRRSAHVLSTLRPGDLASWNWDWPVGAGEYWALYPYAWYEFDRPDLPVRIVQRQFSPVIPHDYTASSYPVALFETCVENRSVSPVTVGLMLTWRNDIGLDRGQAGGRGARTVRPEGYAGVVLEGRARPGADGWDATLALAAEAADGVELSVCERFDARADTELWTGFAEDGRLGKRRYEQSSGAPSTASEQPARSAPEQSGVALAATFRLEPGEKRVVPFALAWDLPIAEFGSGTRWRKRYTRFFGADGHNAWAIATEGLRRRGEWSAAIDAWQAPIIEDPDRPDWYKAALFNELYYLVDGGTLWTDGAPDTSRSPTPKHAALPESDPDVGRFALLECFDYAFYNTLDVAFYSSWATLLLWPRLDVAALRDFAAAVETEDPELRPVAWTGGAAPRQLRGAVPHDVGGPREDPFLRPNLYSWRDINTWKDLNSKLVLQIWRDVALLDDRALAIETWPAVVMAMDYLAGFDLDGDGLPENDGRADQTYDTWPMRGPSAYCGGLWLAALQASTKLGIIAGDDAAARRYGDLLDRASASYERRLWTGNYYRYDASGTGSSESIMADQLAGQWYADATGLGDLVPPEHVAAVLKTVFERNVLGFEGGSLGAVNGMRPDGSVDETSDQSAEVWLGVTYGLAAFMLGRGLTAEAWRTAQGAYRITYERGLWFRTPEAYTAAGSFRAGLYLRPLAIWAIEDAIRRRSR